MFTIDNYLPTRVVFGPGRLDELKNMKLPGKRALMCVTADGLMEELGIQQRTTELLRANHVECIIFNQVKSNPTMSGVNTAVALAKANDCDFVIGLGGGSSIDTAKATAIMMVSEGSLWDYAYTGTGGRKEITHAAPIVTISTTCGTGTECDPFCVITNEATREKLDFAGEAIFPTLSIIDPQLMVTLPRSLTIFQGFDALFHAAECYVANGHQNRMVDLYASESVRTVALYLEKAVNNPKDLEARTNMAFAADILSGYTQALTSVTSHHIIAQTLGGMYPSFQHGATLIALAEAYYTKVCSLLPDEFDELGEMMGIQRTPDRPGYAFVQGIIDLMEKTDSRYLKMSDFGVMQSDFDKIVSMTVDQVGIDLDRYTLTKDDFVDILETSYR